MPIGRGLLRLPTSEQSGWRGSMESKSRSQPLVFSAPPKVSHTFINNDHFTSPVIRLGGVQDHLQ